MLNKRSSNFKVTMSKRSPFDYVKGINQKTYDYDLSGYIPFLTNKTFAMHLDTILLAEEMNQAHKLSPQLQYDFYYHAVRKGKRFGFPPKPEQNDDIDLICEVYKYSQQKAKEALKLLTPEQLQSLKESRNTGGTK